MKQFVIGAGLALLVAGSAAAQGQHWVNGYYRGDGTYVQGHMQTNPDGNPYNNWTTQGNVNPYTGQVGTRNPLGYAPVPQTPVPRYYPQQPYQAAPLGGGINPNVNRGIPQRTCGYGGPCF